MSKWALSALHFPEGLERTLCWFPRLAPVAGWGEALVCRHAGSDWAPSRSHSCELTICDHGELLRAPTPQAVSQICVQAVCCQSCAQTCVGPGDAPCMGMQ